MSQQSYKPSRRRRVIYVLTGLVALLVLIVVLLKTVFRSPAAAIKAVMRKEGWDDQYIKLWTAISAFETNGWSSRVFKDSKNAFNIIVPGSTKLDYGEGQTIYPSVSESVTGLIKHVIGPFDYPTSASSLQTLVHIMKQKGYFTSSEDDYLAGARAWYLKLYGESIL